MKFNGYPPIHHLDTPFLNAAGIRRRERGLRAHENKGESMRNLEATQDGVVVSPIGRTGVARPLHFALAILFIVAGSTVAMGSGAHVYDSIPTPLPPNVPSLGFQANQTA